MENVCAVRCRENPATRHGGALEFAGVKTPQQGCRSPGMAKAYAVLMESASGLR
jgi:hypothetical protein